MIKISLIFLFFTAVQAFSVAEKVETEIRLSEHILNNREIRLAESKKGIDGKKDSTKIKQKIKGKGIKKDIRSKKENKNKNKKEGKKNGIKNKKQDGNRKGKKKENRRKKGKKKGNGKRKGKKEDKIKERPTGIRKGKKKENGWRTGNKKGNGKSKGNDKGNKKKKLTGIRKGRKKGNRNKKGNGNNKGNKEVNFNKRIKMKKIERKKSKPDQGHLSGRQTCDVSTTCFETAVNFLKIWKDLVINFDQQKNRMTKQNKTGGKKSGKKGLFAPVVQRLIEAGGGNKSNLSCYGNYKNAGAKQLTNLTMILHGCELKINASCNPANFPKPNTTLLKECDTLITTFKTKASSCLKQKTVSAACSCWTDSTLNKTVIALKNCKFSNESKAITAQLRQCTGNFSICRKFEDDTITAIMACSKSTTKLLAKAKSLTSNKNEMTKAKDKMSTLSGSSSGRIRRATATKCSEIISKSKQITTLTSDSPSNDKITTLSKEISSSSITCTTTEQTSLKTEVTSMKSAIVVITVALETVQTNLLTITGTTASSAVIAAASDSSSTSTVKASGRRNMLIREAINRVKKTKDLTN